MSDSHSSQSPETSNPFPRGLWLTLTSGERLLINGAEIVFTQKTRVVLPATAGRPSFLFADQVMDEASAYTPLRRLYFDIQRAHAGDRYGDTAERFRLETLMHDAWRYGDEDDIAPTIESARRHVVAGQLLDALKLIRTLIEAESMGETA